MPHQHTAQFPQVARDVRGPVRIVLGGQADLAEHRVEREVEQIVPIRHVPVQAGRVHVEGFGQPPHGQPRDTGAVEELHGGGHDPRQRERGFGTGSAWFAQPHRSRHRRLARCSLLAHPITSGVRCLSSRPTVYVRSQGSLLTATYRASLPPGVTERGSLAETVAARPELAKIAAEAFVDAQSVTMLAAAACTATGALVAFLLVRSAAAPADGAGDGEDRLEYS